MSVDQASIIVGITLGEPLQALAGATAASAVAGEAGRRLSAVARGLGVPGHVVVTVDTDHAASARPLAISVHGMRIEYPRSLDQQVLMVRRSQLGSARGNVSGLPTWREHLAAGEAECIGAVSEVAAHAVAARASAMLGPAQVEMWADAAPEPVGDRVGDVLRELLDLRLSIGDHERIAAVLTQGAGLTAADAAERVTEAIRPATMEARVEPAYLAEITRASASSGHDKFPFLRDGLYQDLGLRLPSLRLVPDPGMARCCYAIRVNHLTTPPVLGPPPGMCLVNVPAEEISRIAPNAIPALNPASDVPGAIVPADMRGELSLYGYTTWDPLEHLVLTLAETARIHARGLIDRGVVTREIDLFRQTRPVLARIMLERLSVDRFTRLLRSLLDERVPVRDLRRVCQGVVDEAVTGLPESDESLLALARRASAPAITKSATSRQSIVAYLLDGSLEADVAATDDDVAWRATQSLLAALDTNLAELPATAIRPLLLTTSAARPSVRRAVMYAWPRLPVLAYDELEPAANVMPIARLSPTPAA